MGPSLAWLMISLFLENGANIMQARNEAAPVDFLAAAGAVAEADDVRRALAQAGLEGQVLAPVDQRHEAGLSVLVIAHEDGQLSARHQCAGAIADQQPVACQ